MQRQEVHIADVMIPTLMSTQQMLTCGLCSLLQPACAAQLHGRHKSGVHLMRHNASTSRIAPLNNHNLPYNRTPVSHPCISTFGTGLSIIHAAEARLAGWSLSHHMQSVALYARFVKQ